MIRTLKLSSWRNYEDLSLDLGAGTTFLVASNGVGKTSLVEAARWALFGEASSSGSPVRVGADRAIAIVELVLPTGQILIVERNATTKVSRKAAVVPTISLDGSPIDEDAFSALLREAYGTEPDFLARLTMPAVSRDLETPTGLGLEDHLGRYFGVDGLQRAIELLNVEIKNTEKNIRQIKNANSASANQLAELVEATAVAASAVELAATEHTAAKDAQTQLEAGIQAQRSRDEWQSRHARWLADSTDLATEVARALNIQIAQQDIEARLEKRAEEYSQTAQDARIQIAIRESRTEAILANQDRLDDAHDEDCPVCRRPLDVDTVALAHQSNESELQILAAEITTLRTDEATASDRRQQLLPLLQKWKGLPHPGPEPAALDSPIPGPANLELARIRVDEALEGLVTSRAEQVHADRRLQETRDSDDAMKQLHALFGAEASFRVALQTTEATLDELLEQTIRPLASEVDERWKALFPNRGDLTTHADGSITRNVNGNDLPYDAFSTGEGIAATIVLKLLVAQMATAADFCWFDEPLEHLDPNVRRQVANILARASDGAGQLRQILITTYEEPLARHLHERSPDRVHLIDVRQAPVDAITTVGPTV